MTRLQKCLVGFVFAAAVLCCSNAAAQTDSVVLPHDESQKFEPNYWVPALEIFGQHLLFNVVARVADKDYAKTTPSSVWDNLTGPWEIDEDAFLTNQIGHPYQGALYMTAARSSGVSFWLSALYTTLGSLGWEYLWETERPSLNDQLTTSLSGVVLGEVMHRFAIAILYDETHRSHWMRRLGALAVDPQGSLNRELIWPNRAIPKTPSFFAMGRLGYGVFGTDNLEQAARTPRVVRQLHLSVDAVYGRPSEPEWIGRAPLDHLDVLAELDLAESDAVGSLYLRGLLFGDNHRAGPISGMYGLYAGHDFYTPDGLRVGAFTLGLGATLEADLGGKWFAQGTIVTGAVPFGAMGFRESTGLRDYQLGPGAFQLNEVAVGRRDLGVLQLTTRSISIDLPFEGPARSVGQTTFSAVGKVWRNIAAGAEARGTVSSRLEVGSEPTATMAGLQIRVFIAVVSGSGFGSVVR